jgi:hypothetical protein
MSQDAGAGQSKRSPAPAYVYGPMVYQFPSEGDSAGEKEKSESMNNKSGNYPVVVLIVLLVVGAILLYLRENRVDVGQLNFRNSFGEVSGADYNQRNAPVVAQARVAADRLYLREGPGMIYVATYLLPEHWRVSLMGDYETDDYGEIWARVLVQTDQGTQEGWVSRRYLK